MKVVVFGSSGMLGAYVSKYLDSCGFLVDKLTRHDLDIKNCNESQLETIIAGSEVVVNCAGIIRSRIKDVCISEVINVNSIFPHTLASVCKRNGVNIIHITTDCVYSGKDGKYTEDCAHDALDVYGKSKSLGESPNATVIRTSIIGKEKDSAHSLLEWAIAQRGKQVNGFLNHFWNGITCLQLSKLIEKVIVNNSYWLGTRHVFSGEDYSKAEMIRLFSDTYGLGLDVKNINVDAACDRTLRTKYDTCNAMQIPPFTQQIEEMRAYKL